MRGDEARVVEAFVRWLETDGWRVQREISWVDVAAEKDGLKLYAEAKGRTAAIGLDVDTLYGQLLRRIRDDEPAARYAVVVPTAGIAAALRVSPSVRRRLAVDVFEVDDQDQVHLR